jgi:hypothetical protein
MVGGPYSPPTRRPPAQLVAMTGPYVYLRSSQRCRTVLATTSDISLTRFALRLSEEIRADLLLQTAPAPSASGGDISIRAGVGISDCRDCWNFVVDVG